MSRIITQLHCKKCGTKTDTYMSFGHPKKDFNFNWTCDNCKSVNTEVIEALSYSKEKYYKIFKACEDCHYNTPYMCALDYNEAKGIAYCPDAKGETVPTKEAEQKSAEAIQKCLKYEAGYTK